MTQFLWNLLGFGTYSREIVSVLHCSLSLVSGIKFLARWKSHRAQSTWSKMSDTVLRFWAFDTWRGWVHAAPGHGSVSAAPPFSSFTLLQWSTGPGRALLIPTTYRTLPHPELGSKYLKSCLWHSVRTQSIALWLKLIILSNFPVSEDALFVLVPFSRIKDQYYGIPRWAHQVFFFFLKSTLQSLSFCWNRNCLTSPLKSPTSLVFFLKSCLADRDYVHFNLMILFSFQMESPVRNLTGESHP